MRQAPKYALTRKLLRRAAAAAAVMAGGAAGSSSHGSSFALVAGLMLAVELAAAGSLWRSGAAGELHWAAVPVAVLAGSPAVGAVGLLVLRLGRLAVVAATCWGIYTDPARPCHLSE